MKMLGNVRPWGGEPMDMLLADGQIAEIAPTLAAPADCERIDGEGDLLLPALVDGHAHVDKTLWGQPWHPHQAGPTLIDRIRNEREVLSGMDHDPERQSARLLRHMLSRGSTRVRTHVDVGPDVALSHLEGVMAMREAHSRWMDVQIVAFPQTGVMLRPGTADLLEQAIAAGAEVLGGLDPVGVDRDPRGQLDALFDIVERHGCDLDFHLHDRGEVGALGIELIAERVRALSLHGRVTLSHAFCLGEVAPARFESLVALLLEGDIAIMSHGPGGGTPVPPARALHAAGVRVFSGSDGVRDTWGPLNTGDMLERAFLVAYVNGFRDDPGLELALHMATTHAAQVMGCTDYGLAVGCRADLILLPASTPAEAVVSRPVRRLVLHGGEVVARDGVCVLPPI